MANVLQNAAFADSLFKPVSQILTGFGESNLATEQLQYKDRLRNIARQQELLDQQEKYDQAVAIENLRTNGAMAVAKETTERQGMIEKSRDDRQRQFQLDNAITAAATAYHEAEGVENPDPTLEGRPLLNWYMSRIGPQKQSKTDKAEARKSEAALHEYGLKPDYAEGASWADKRDSNLRRIAEREGTGALGLATEYDEAITSLKDLNRMINTFTADDQAIAMSTALGSLSGKAAQKLKDSSADFQAGLTDPESVRALLNEFPGAYQDFIGAYNKTKAGLIGGRSAQFKNDVDNAQERFATAAKWMTQPGVRYHVGQMELYRAQGRDPKEYLSSVGGDAMSTLGGGGDVARPAAAAAAPGSGTDILNTFGRSFNRAGGGAAAAPSAPAAPRRLRDTSMDAILAAGTGAPMPAAPQPTGSNPNFYIQRDQPAGGDLVAPPAAAAAAAAAASGYSPGIQGNTLDEFTPLRTMPSELSSMPQGAYDATPGNLSNQIPRRLDRVDDAARGGLRSVAEFFGNYSAEERAQALLTRYDQLRDKTSPLAIGLLKEAAKLVSATPSAPIPTVSTQGAPAPGDLDAGLPPSIPGQQIPTVSSRPMFSQRYAPPAPVEFNNPDRIPTVSTSVPPVEFSTTGPIPTVQTEREIPTVRTERTYAPPPRISMGDRLTEGLAPWRESTEVNPDRYDAIADTLRSTGQALIRPFSPGGDIEKDLRSRLAALRDKDSPRAKKLKAQIKEFEDERESYKKRKTSTRRSADEIDAEILSDRKQPASYNRGSDRLTRAEEKVLNTLNTRYDDADPDSEEAAGLLNEIIARTPVGRALPIAAYLDVNGLPINPISKRLTEEDLRRMMLNQLRSTR